MILVPRHRWLIAYGVVYRLCGLEACRQIRIRGMGATTALGELNGFVDRYHDPYL